MTSSVFDDAAFNRRAFFPRRDVSSPPPGARDFMVPGDAALHLRWHCRSVDWPTVLFFHGNGEVVSDYDAIAPSFHHSGANLAVAEFRGYGASEGVPSVRSLVVDAPRVLTFVQQHVPGPLRVMGRSLGSLCAVELYARAPTGVDGFIFESGIGDLEAFARRRGITAPALSPSDRADFDPVHKLPRGTGPLLVIHGEEDALISPREAQALVAAAGSRDKHLVLIPERGHNDLSSSPLYWEAVQGFVGTQRRT